MAKSRRANAVVFGFDFQVNAAIVLMIENIEDLKSLRLEGNYEDIEIELENNQYILAQAKAVERSSSDFRNVRKNLEKSLISLSEGNQKVDAQRLILITNSPNPLNEEASRSIFWGDAHREFLSLPESSQELIRRYLDNINQPLDTDKFMIQILPFETDNDIERYKVVKRVVDDFIGDLNLNIPGLGKKLLSIWHEEVFENGTNKDAAIQLKKKDLICGIAISYLVRVNISHAIIPIAEEYSLNEVQQGMLLSAFAWGYVALMFIGGILVDKFGALKMSFRSAIAWSVCTAVSSVGFCWPMIFSSELLAGASEAPIFPANAKIVRNNFEENERGRATAIFDSGSYVGTAISAPLMSFLIINLSWRYAYIVIAIIGILWAIIWKQISKDLYDTNEITSKVKLSKENVFSCIVNRKVLGMSIGFFCYNYIKNFYLTWFPSYLVSEKGFSILKVGIWGMLPSIAAVFGGLIAGTITDKMISNGHSKTLSRKLPLCVGLICSGSIVFADSVHSGYLAVALLSFSFAMAIAASPSIWAIPGDIAPDSNLVGTIGGIQNTVSNIAGIVAPIITGYIIYKTGGFKVALLASGIISCIGAFSYIFVVGKLEAIDIGN